MDFLNPVTFSEGVKCVFAFTEKWYPVNCYDLNNSPMEGLGLKPLRIYLESTKDIYV